MVNLPYSTRQLVWLGNTRETLSAFPIAAKQVLAFMKKSKTGRSIPNEIKQTLVARLKQAMQLAAERNE